MLDNCVYNRVKLMHDLSRTVWFMKHFCHKDAKVCKCKTKACQKLLMQTQKDLEKIINVLGKSLK